MKVTETRTFALRKGDFIRINPAGLSIDEAWTDKPDGGWWIPDVALSDEEYSIYASLCDSLRDEG